MGLWPWLAALAILLGTGLTFLLRQVIHRRGQRAAWVAIANQQFQDETPPVASSEAIDEEVPLELYAEPERAQSELEGSVPVFFTPTETAPTRGPEPARSSEPPVAQPLPQHSPSQTTVGPLGISLAARRMSATLMNTVLNYELVVTNRGEETIGPIHVGGDMIGAHASLPTRSQLELSGHSIEPLHTLAVLAPGESTVLEGELRLALSAITPIRSGIASLFVPLVRFRVEALRKGAPPLVLNHTSVIGESQHSPGSALKPFRLDLGPRLYSDISQRELVLT